MAAGTCGYYAGNPRGQNIHLDEFRAPLAHGEILLRVDAAQHAWPVSRTVPTTITRKQRLAGWLKE